jgi:predicted nucleotidyltransferase
MNNVRILVHLLDHKEQAFTINGLARALNMNYRLAHHHVKLLESQEVIATQRVGNSLLCSLTNKFNEYVFLAEYERRKQLLKNKNINIIYQRLRQAKHSFIALVFGSYARKQQSTHSDIDILFVTDHEEELRRIIELIPVKIHFSGISHASFLKMVRSSEFSVVREALKNNIILFGIEDYYRFIDYDE